MLLMIGCSGNKYHLGMTTNTSVPMELKSNKCKFHYKVLNEKTKEAAIIKVDNPGKVVKIPKSIDGYKITQIGKTGEQ